MSVPADDARSGGSTDDRRRRAWRDDPDRQPKDRGAVDHRANIRVSPGVPGPTVGLSEPPGVPAALPLAAQCYAQCYAQC